MTWCIEAGAKPKKVKCFVEMTVTSDIKCTKNDIKEFLEYALNELPIRISKMRVTLNR